MTETITPPGIHLVEVTDEDGVTISHRVFATADAAQTYAGEWEGEPDVEASIYHLPVSTTAPRLVRYVEVGFGLRAYRRGLRWWTGDLTAENVGIAAVHRYDEDEFPAHRQNVAVGVEHDARHGDTGLRVFGTDEALVRATYVAEVRRILGEAGEQ